MAASSSQQSLLSSPARMPAADCWQWRVTQQATRLLFARLPVIRRAIILLLLLTVLSLMVLCYYVSNVNPSTTGRAMHQPTSDACREHVQSSQDHDSPARLRIDSKVLVLVETMFTNQGQDIVTMLEANRVRYKMEVVSNSLPSFTHLGKGRFGVVVFERLESYLNMDKWNRELLDKYCRDYNVGIVAFTRPDNVYINAQVKGFPLFIHSKLSLSDYWINPDSSLLRVTKPGAVLDDIHPASDWTVFVPNHTTYQAVSYSRMLLTNDMPGEHIHYIPAVLDRGLYDGIQRVIFGQDFHFWLHRMLFIDALSYLSHGRLSVPLDRYMLIDVDDIFVGKKGIRMTAADVHAMVEAQQRLRQHVPGFTFNVGFSGFYYQAGTPEENQGDAQLIAMKDQFWWFPHMWRHLQPHNFNNVTALMEEMEKNKQFAELHGLPVNQSYAVAPHHSGVYPVHHQLYEAWSTVWGVSVTSTEEYPHLRPARRRKGFIYNGIKVLPRQTCGLYTHTLFLDKYPGGQVSLDRSIQGGELFQAFLYNTVNVFMTHLSNYGNDRLALYTFEKVVKFVQCWTNLKLKTLPPVKLADYYFSLYPEEEEPIWRNPCLDKRHLTIWSENKSCGRLPRLLVVGPQKTGTTALYSFLNMHPDVTPSLTSPTTFEEVQFFNGKNYMKGLDWYMEFFPPLPNNSSHLLYEKSANYFDSEVTPRRAHALLPKARIICILIDPAKRAYSWYQHMRAHDDPLALSHSFYEVISATEDASRPLRDLQQRCLKPGYYADHIQSWLDYYNPKQMLILDGEQLKLSPAVVMEDVQRFLALPRHYDYSRQLRFNSKKGFFCQVVKGDHTRCLGRGKGRTYPPMSDQETAFLRDLYMKDNTALSKLLTKLGRTIPDWLQAQLGDAS